MSFPIQETLTAMFRQEQAYTPQDCLHQETPLPEPVRNALHVDIDQDCRNKMVTWSYQVVDFCKFSRESVEIAMNYLDRFIATPAGQSALQDRNVYQLASMTCLYTAVKTHERQAMHPNVVAQLSQNTYTAQQVEAMEAVILGALQWRLNPPTSIAFVRELMMNIHLPKDTKEVVMELAKLQTELAVNDYKFLTTTKSTIAYCSLKNSLEAVLGQSTAMDMYSLGHDTSSIQSQLYDAVAQHDTLPMIANPKEQHVRPKSVSRRASLEESPRAIAQQHEFCR